MLRHLRLIKHLRLIVGLAVFALSSLILTAPAHAHAANFDPGHIIDDSRFIKQTMDVPAIQNWLNTINSTCLKNYNAPDPLGAGNYGNNVSAATVIGDTARITGINPQVLLATLNKEQGLITRSDCPQWRYDTAMGFACPDTSPCSDQYKGFSKQVYEGAKLLRNCFYQDKPGWFCSYIPYTTGVVKYNPTASCGSTNVYISNRATATLYNYTPYQPNQAVLNGGADNCSAYGNLNFKYWMDFWFPDPSSSGFSLVKGASTQSQYILQSDNGNLSLRLVPSPDVILAWGLDKVALQTVSDSVISTTTKVLPDLTRLARPSGALTVYFMDGGQRHAIPSLEMMAAWNLPTSSIVDVNSAVGLVANAGPDLSYAVRSSTTTDTRVLMMDGGTLRQYQDPNTLSAWEGDSPIFTLSSAYLASYPTGPNLTHSRLIDTNNNQYIADSGRKFILDPSRATIYPWTAQTVSQATMNRLSNGGPAPVFVQGAGDAAVYLLDSNQKHRLADPNVLHGWLAGQSVARVSGGLVGLIATGATVQSYFGDNGGQLFVLDNTKLTVPSALDSAYRTGQIIFPISTPLSGLLSTGATLTGLVKGAGSPNIYVLDSTARLRRIGTPRQLRLWAGPSPAPSVLSDPIVAMFPAGSDLGAYISDGTNEYVLDGGSKLPVPGATKADWGLSAPTSVDATTLARFTTGAALNSNVRAGTAYYLVRSGLGYVTTDANIAGMWNLAAATQHSADLMDEFLPPRMLTRFVSSSQPNDTRIFTTDNGVLYHLSPGSLQNLGYNGEAKAVIDPSALSGFTTSVWSGVILKSTANAYYVVDSGGKRLFPSSIVQDYWTNNGVTAVAQASDGFINLLPTRGLIERAIKGSSPSVYASPGAQKRWITSPATYNQNYAPFANVSDALLNEMPTGPSL